jgi:hypothetical protein
MSYIVLSLVSVWSVVNKMACSFYTCIFTRKRWTEQNKMLIKLMKMWKGIGGYQADTRRRSKLKFNKEFVVIIMDLMTNWCIILVHEQTHSWNHYKNGFWNKLSQLALTIWSVITVLIYMKLTVSLICCTLILRPRYELLST